MKETSLIEEEALNKCHHCNGSVVLMNTGHTCSKCGTVFDVHYAEENYLIHAAVDGYTQKTSKQFIGLGKQLDNVTSLGSYIDHFNAHVFFDAKNNPLPVDKQRLFYRLKFTEDFRAKVNQNETYYRIIKIMKTVAGSLDLISDVRKRAVYMYKRVLKGTKSLGQKIPNHVSLMGTCVFIAAREHAPVAPITVHEICNTFKEHGHRVNCKMIIRDMLKFKNFLDIKRTTRDSKDYLERLTSKLGYDDNFARRFSEKNVNACLKQYIQEIKNLAARILDSIPASVKSTRNSFILAGAAIYGADVLRARRGESRRALTQKLLADATGIAEYSIRDHYCSVIKHALPACDERHEQAVVKTKGKMRGS